MITKKGDANHRGGQPSPSGSDLYGVYVYVYMCLSLPLSPFHSPDLSKAFLCVVSRRSLAMKSCSSSFSSEKSG